ncbi:MAG: GNAT family N-acetyltransferase [Phycisphaerales bacterium]|nr:GNAT family N-acetyltransferase [Phycisphaerales bacterium]
MPRVQALSPGNLRDALGMLLAGCEETRVAPDWQIESFQRYMATGVESWQGWEVGRGAERVGLALALHIPGRVGVVMIPQPGRFGMTAEGIRSALENGLSDLQAERLHYANAIIEPHALAKRGVLESCGFREITQLIYLERSLAAKATVEAPIPLRWRGFSTDCQPLFEEALRQTYIDSADCPELTNLRPMADVIAAHKASGPFDAALWEVATHGREAVGCVLVSRLEPAGLCELTYVGVSPAYRGRGLGATLVARAIELARETKARTLTLAVDHRNATARRLYDRFQFRRLSERDTFLFTWA